jgi:hypothetical protein
VKAAKCAENSRSYGGRTRGKNYPKRKFLLQGQPTAAGDLCKPQCDKDPDSAFILGQPGRRKPPVRKTSLNA